jgi:Flp pilus assembly protein TadG
MSPPLALLTAARRAARRFTHNRRGATAVEFALIAPVFFALVFAIIETSLVFFAGQILEIGTQDTARLLYTNQAQGTMTQSQFQQSLCSQVSVLLSCSGVYVDVKAYSSFTAITAADLADPIDASGNFVNNFAYQSSNPGDTVVVRAFYQWPLFVTGLGYNIANIGRGTSSSYKLLTATAAFRVEPGP